MKEYDVFSDSDLKHSAQKLKIRVLQTSVDSMILVLLVQILYH